MNCLVRLSLEVDPTSTLLLFFLGANRPLLLKKHCALKKLELPTKNRNHKDIHKKKFTSHNHIFPKPRFHHLQKCSIHGNQNVQTKSLLQSTSISKISFLENEMKNHNNSKRHPNLLQFAEIGKPKRA